MKKQDLRAAAEKAQIEINDQINQFIAKLDEASDDPNDFITMTALESEWRKLSQATSKSYSGLVSEALCALDTKELNKAKKKHLPQGRDPIKERQSTSENDSHP